MHAKSGLRVVLKWKIYRPDSVIAAVVADMLWIEPTPPTEEPSKSDPNTWFNSSKTGPTLVPSLVKRRFALRSYLAFNP